MSKASGARAAKKAAAKKGRPTTYSKDRATEILDRISDGESLRSVCSSSQLPPHSTILNWVKDDVDGFSDRYARAREIQCDMMFDDLHELSRKALTVAQGEPGTGEAGARVQAIRIEIDTLKWILAKRFPERWADRVKTENTNTEKSELSLTPEAIKQLGKIQKIKNKINPPGYKNGDDPT